MTIKQIVKKYSSRLKYITHIPAKEVEILIGFILDKNNIWLHLNYDKEFNEEKKLKQLVEKRAENYPLEYIIKKVSFYGESFNINEGVLIPRPETEILVDKAVEILKTYKNGIKVLEIGTGSGIISVMLALLIGNIEIIAVDINDKALELAQKNAKKFNVLEKITFIKSDLFKNIEINKIDMVISNPPYIANDYKLPTNVKFEPSNALFGGEIGDEILKNIILESKQRKVSHILCEIGYDQKAPLEKFINNLDIKEYSFYKDYENFDRGFIINLNK